MKTTLRIINSEVKNRALLIIRALPLDVIHIVEIKEYKSNRSKDQNALHWKRLDIIRLHVADSTGQIYSAEDLHEFFKAKFLPVHMVDVGGLTEIVGRTTTNLNTKEFAAFMDSIDRYCIDLLNLYLPTPEMMES